MINGLKRWRLFGGLVLVVSVALMAGASSGRAATSFVIDLQPLIGTTGENEIPQVSYGRKIGYSVHVANDGESTTTQVQIRVTSDAATFADADNPACVVNPSNARQMICTPTGGSLKPGDTFDTNLRFTAPASGTQVSTVASIVIAAQSVGGKKNNGTTLQSSDPVLTNLVAGSDKEDTYLRQNEAAATGGLNPNHPQNFGVQLPSTLLGAPFGVALSVHDHVGTPICATCLTSFTTLTIPAAASATMLGNPFYDGITLNPYAWSMKAQYAMGFNLTGIFHVDDTGATELLPSCASIGGAPTAADPLCWDTLTQNKGSKTVAGTGRGIENGKIGFG